MTRNNKTPVDFWLGLRLSELSDWIATNNELEQEAKQRAKEAAQNR